MKVILIFLFTFLFVTACDYSPVYYNQNYEDNYFLEENFGTPFWYYNSYESNWPFFYDYPFNWRYNYW